MSLTFDTRVAATAAAHNPKQMRQEFARVLHVPAQADGRKRHRLAFREVLYFKLKGSLEKGGMLLTPKDRRALYQVLVSKNQQVGAWQRLGRTLVRTGDVTVTLDLTKIVRSTQSTLRMIRRGETLIERRSDRCSGAPVFKGTRVPLMQIVEQFRSGVPLAQIAEDYPHIDEKALHYAELYSRMSLAPGRPRQTLRVQRTTIEPAH